MKRDLRGRLRPPYSVFYQRVNQAIKDISLWGDLRFKISICVDIGYFIFIFALCYFQFILHKCRYSPCYGLRNSL
jgi:hypothetical protein